MQIIIPILIIFIFGGIYAALVTKKDSNEKDAYLLKYPEAIKVIIDRVILDNGIDEIIVHRVNGEKPVLIKDGNLDAFLCKAGENFIEASHNKTKDRLYTLNLDAKLGSNYILTFDKNEERLKINRLR
ncbi:MAG: hypothetical protein Q4P29_06565 [Tissierellia bacterium]|nr:hypothetical protein [Tissierellia bacterium]